MFQPFLAFEEPLFEPFSAFVEPLLEFWIWLPHIRTPRPSSKFSDFLIDGVTEELIYVDGFPYILCGTSIIEFCLRQKLSVALIECFIIVGGVLLEHPLIKRVWRE